MAAFDRANLLLRLGRELTRPATDAELPLAVAAGSLALELLSDAQDEIAERLAIVAPESNYTVIALTSADNKVYTTASAAVEWLGEIEVYRDNRLKGPPMGIGAAWNCSKDWTVEGERSIRLTCGREKAFPTLTARAFVRPAEITDSVEPSIRPLRIRRAVVALAAANFCTRGGKRDPRPFLAKAGRIFDQTVSALRANQSGGISGGGGWWNLTGDLGRVG